MLGAACGPSPPPAAPAVILITCDTLRADRLGLYGWAAGTSPNLDALAEESMVFESAWSTAPLTIPSVAALLTGRTPEEVGLSSNRGVLSDEATTLAEVLAEHGFDCAAIVSNWVLRRRDQLPDAGVQQGFAYFDDDMGSAEENRPHLMERIAAHTTDAALRWLDTGRSDRPFFLWVHYQDPHGPYTAPDDCLGTSHPEPGERGLPVGQDQSGYGALPRYQVLGEERLPSVYRLRYEAEIRYFDREFGRLLAHMRASGLLEEALLIFTADHGESLGERGLFFSHGHNLHRELVRVPLLIRRPGSPAALRVRAPVSHLDLWPTILAALGIPSGASLGMDFLATTPPEDRAVPQFLGREWSLTSARHRLIFTQGRARLYDTGSDLREESDLAASQPEVVQELTRIHDALLERTRARTLPALHPAPSEQGLSELEALGYGGETED